jgi:hypothetical protein
MILLTVGVFAVLGLGIRAVVARRRRVELPSPVAPPPDVAPEPA